MAMMKKKKKLIYQFPCDFMVLYERMKVSGWVAGNANLS